jgi:hypothetical protein
MIDLAQRSEPYEIALPYGLSVTVKPLTTAGMDTAQAAARRSVEAIERPECCRACRDDGLPCARGEPGADGRHLSGPGRDSAAPRLSCPYREHALTELWKYPQLSAGVE